MNRWTAWITPIAVLLVIGLSTGTGAEPAPPEPPATRPASAPADKAPPAHPRQPPPPAAANADDAPLTDQAPDDAPAEIAANFHVRPRSIRVNSYIYLDEEGKIQSEQHHLNIGLQVRYPQDLRAVEYELLSIDEVVTGAGERLPVSMDDNRHRGTLHHHHRHRGGQREFSLNLNVPLPATPSTKLERLRGRMKVSVAVGPERQAVLRPFKDIVNRRIPIEEFPGSHLTLSREHGDRVRISMSETLMRLLSRAEFRNADGTVLNVNGWVSGSRGDTHFRDYHVQLPDDGQVILHFFADTRDIEVPFELEDVKLPVPPRHRHQPDLVINLQPLDDDAAAIPEHQRLHVVIED